jgi:1-acyl-sn-glycerol-3-phosphate acyltransferase
MPVDIMQESRILRLGRWLYKLKVIGEENIPQQGAFVVAFNHSARYLDSMSIQVIKAHRPDFIAFGAVGMPQSGWIARFLKRRSEKEEDAEPSTLGAIKARGFSAVELLKAYKYLHAGRPVVVAAEGEVPWDGELIHPLAPGSAWMALRTHVPVLPIVLIGGYDILPRWRDYPKLSGRITIRVGPPFYVGDQATARVDEQAIGAASQIIYEKMASLIGQGHA